MLHHTYLDEAPWQEIRDIQQSIDFEFSASEYADEIFICTSDASFANNEDRKSTRNYLCKSSGRWGFIITIAILKVYTSHCFLTSYALCRSGIMLLSGKGRLLCRV
jgi:hypothetical protein